MSRSRAKRGGFKPLRSGRDDSPGDDHELEQAERLARFQREMHEQHQQQEALHRTAMLAGIATEDCQQCDHTQSTACFSSEV